MSNFGKEPTVAQKVANTNKKFGLSGISNQQGSAVNIFDTVTLTTNAQPQVLNFFTNSGNKAATFSNWQQGELKAGEALGVKFIYVHLIQMLNTNLSDSANTISNFFPAGRTPATSVIAYGTAEFKIANVTVLKDYQLIELLPMFNPGNQGIAAYDVAAATLPSVFGRSVIELDTVPVIIPNQAVKFIVTVPPITLPAGNFAMMVTLGRQGSIFSAKTSF